MFAVTTARGPAWDDELGIRQQSGWDTHASFMDRLVERGTVILGGPIEGAHGEVALLAVQAADEGRLRDVFAKDPWASSGILRVKEIRAWTIWLDSRQELPDV